MEFLLGFITNDFIVFNAFLTISVCKNGFQNKKFKTIDILKVIRYAGTYKDSTENFRFFCFIANCIKNYKEILCIFTASIYGTSLDSDFRRKLQTPDKLIKRSGITEGMRILEIGCGSGAFTTFAAKASGIKGELYALDIQPRMLMQLKKKLSRPENRDIKNIKLVEGDVHKLPFDDNSFDLVYMVTVLQELPDRNRALKEIKRVLKPGGILAITEFLPDPDYPLKSTTIKLGEEAGFILDRVEGNLWNYTVRFKAQKSM